MLWDDFGRLLRIKGRSLSRVHHNSQRTKATLFGDETYHTMSDGQTAIECTITESKSPEQSEIRENHPFEELELPPTDLLGESQITYSR